MCIGANIQPEAPSNRANIQPQDAPSLVQQATLRACRLPTHHPKTHKEVDQGLIVKMPPGMGRVLKHRCLGRRAEGSRLGSRQGIVHDAANGVEVNHQIPWSTRSGFCCSMIPKGAAGGMAGLRGGPWSVFDRGVLRLRLPCVEWGFWLAL